MKRFLTIVLLAVLFGGPMMEAREKARPEILFEHKYEKKYNCTMKLETLRVLAPLMGADFKAELAETYIALTKAIEEAVEEGQTGQKTVCAKGITSVLTFKEDGLMDVRMELSKAWLTLSNVTVKDLKKVFERYLAK